MRSTVRIRAHPPLLHAAARRAPCSASATTPRSCACGARHGARGIGRHAGRRPAFLRGRRSRAARPQGARRQSLGHGGDGRDSRAGRRSRSRCRAPTRAGSARSRAASSRSRGKHRVDLIGGDTTRGPLAICVQIMGEVPRGQALRRDGARVGDDVWVSGELGGAALARGGLRRASCASPRASAARSKQRLHAPTPRVALGHRAARHRPQRDRRLGRPRSPTSATSASARGVARGDRLGSAARARRSCARRRRSATSRRAALLARRRRLRAVLHGAAAAARGGRRARRARARTEVMLIGRIARRAPRRAARARCSIRSASR